MCSNSAWSWSAALEGKLEILEKSQIPYLGRQAGGCIQWSRGAQIRQGFDAQLNLQIPTEWTLRDAANWVAAWPEVGVLAN